MQQLVYTTQAALQQRLPVRFLVDGQPTDSLLGVDVSGPVTNGPALETLALVSISEPPEGVEVTGSFRASGVASSFEATVPWEIRKGDTGREARLQHGIRLDGQAVSLADRPDLGRGPARGHVHVRRVHRRPSGGEGAGPTSDTRTIVVRH